MSPHSRNRNVMFCLFIAAYLWEAGAPEGRLNMPSN